MFACLPCLLSTTACVKCGQPWRMSDITTEHTFAFIALHLTSFSATKTFCCFLHYFFHVSCRRLQYLTTTSTTTVGANGDSATATVTDMASLSATSTTAASAALPLAVHYLASFHQICVVTALLPLVTLFTCFVTAYVFQYDDVHETHCRVSIAHISPIY